MIASILRDLHRACQAWSFWKSVTPFWCFGGGKFSNQQQKLKEFLHIGIDISDRSECLNNHMFIMLDDARQKMEALFDP
jgi:hypothetical protein